MKLHRLRCMALTALSALGHCALAAATSAVVTTPEVRAELVAHAPEGVAPGKAVWLGLKIEHQPHWHTYWKNPGDSGLPTTLSWTLPPGVLAGEIEWPTPHKLPIGPLLNFGYEGTLLLPVPLTVPAGFAGDALEVGLHAEWLVCREVCIPGSGDFTLRVPAQAATGGHAALFASARAALPVTLPAVKARASVEPDALVLRVQGLPTAWQGKGLSFFPETPGLIQNAALPKAQWNGAEWSARVPLDAQRSAAPGALPAVLVAAGEAAGVQLQVAVSGAWPAPAATVAAAGTDTQALPQAGGAALPASPPPTSLGWALLLAVLGGTLLNLMPCVFPVLSLKVLGFAGHAADRRKLLAGGLAYSAGVVVSFVALAGLLLALRAGGEQLGWGFQLQSPFVVASLAALFTLIGLNLAGVFEFGSVLPGSWASARARHPLVDALLTGVLAVAVASPCTAPFMGVSLGLALTLPAAPALAIFAALGLGMALPYLAASAWPAVARWLPRPGAWMAHFRTAMAFPMFATVIWLVWVLGQQAGIDGAAALLALLLALAFAAWALGSPALGPVARRALGLFSLLCAAAALAWAVPALRQDTAAAAALPAGSAWQPWSPARVAQAQADGHPVFVDFTAAWCVTCQFNKRTTLADARVQAAFAERGVVLLRADWTRRDAAISAELARLGRSGVPVYALYQPGDAAPRLLSEILSPGEVLAALEALRKP